jgi:hypothetical protein
MMAKSHTMFKPRNSTLSVLLVLVALCIALSTAAPQNNQVGNNRGARGKNRGGNGGGNRQTPQAKAAQVPGGISTSQDGSTVLDQTVRIK